jgi:hypothetical protein
VLPILILNAVFDQQIQVAGSGGCRGSIQNEVISDLRFEGETQFLSEEIWESI